MNDFVLVQPRDYISKLLALTPRFAASDEYRSMDSEDKRSAGLVFSAFTRFMETSLNDHATRDECVRAIEQFALTNDREAHNLLVVEVFEGFRMPNVSVGSLLPAARALYERWIGA